MTDYEAKAHYQNQAVAARYNAQYEAPLSLGNFRAKFVGAGEQRAFLRMLAPVPRKGRVLDVAAGTGRYTRRLLELGFNVMSSDVSAEMLEFTRTRAAALPNFLGAKVADAAALPFGDKEFDGVTCIRLYQRVPAEVRRRMLSEVSRVAKSWAVLFFGVTTPWLAIRQSLRNAVIRGRANNPNAATLAQVREELSAAGLELEEKTWVMPVIASGIIVRVRVRS